MVQMRKDSLEKGFVYHIFSKSIAGYKIFNDENEYSRIISTVQYYQREKPQLRFAKYLELNDVKKKQTETQFFESEENKLVEIISIMPTHIHFILKQLKKNGISIFMSNALNSYTRFFNERHKRRGPLWQGRFKSVLVDDENQLLHLTRYIHLNPVTSFLVDKPDEWASSSYHEYVNENDEDERICYFDDILDIESSSYKKFVNQRAAYQRELGLIKKLILE